MAKAPSPWAADVGPVWTREEVAAQLDAAPADVDALVTKRGLLRLLTADGVPLFPVWQVTGRCPAPGLSELLATLGPPLVDDWTLASWCRLPRPRLEGRSVAEVLSGGGIGGTDQSGTGRATVLLLARQAAWRWAN